MMGTMVPPADPTDIELKIAAQSGLSAEDVLRARELPLPEAPAEYGRRARIMAHWLLKIAEEMEPTRHDQAVLNRMWAASKPARDVERRALAAEVVTEHAEAYRTAPQARAAQRLCGSLGARVDAAFATLEPEHVLALFVRYEPGRGKRTSAGRGKGKLSAAGVVAELNRLARWPLGRNLSPHAIGNAVAQSKSTREPDAPIE